MITAATARKKRGWSVISLTLIPFCNPFTFSKINQMVIKKPDKKDTEPKDPKKCMGFFLYLFTNETEIRSRNPLKKRSMPNLVYPYFLGLCSTTFSPILLKPFHLAISGI